MRARGDAAPARGRRLAVDTGGTFTDLVLEDGDGRPWIFKSLSIPDDPLAGVMGALDQAADAFGTTRTSLLAETALFIHGTTRSTNAIVTGRTARTAFLTTAGHPDVLSFREGGRADIFNFTRRYPKPYVPRALTYEVPERIDAAGVVVDELDEAAVVAIAQALARERIEAVAVCLLWSIVNPAHELRVGELLREHLPGVPFTLSHELNPIVREYRRASSTAIDASLKPLMTSYFSTLASGLEQAGFRGRLLIVTSNGNVLDADAVAVAPIHSIGSGPAVAPVAGRHYARLEGEWEDAIVADAGGTTYDVSLVRRGRIPRTRETWLGERCFGHMTGFASVDVTSIGAGGGSIAWADRGGLLHVGPESAGASPGPACYARGGERPTVTDACALLGYLDPAFFLGGGMRLDLDAARRAMEEHVAGVLGLDVEAASAAVLELATEHMVQAIEELALKQGIDTRDAVLLAGGGAAGLNAVAIARRLGSPAVVIPEVAAGLSAAGALLSELSADFTRTFVTDTAAFDFTGVGGVLDALRAACERFFDGPGSDAYERDVELFAECRYPHQVWELEVPLPGGALRTAADAERLRQAFHALHREIFAIDDPASHVEVVAWRARARCRLHPAPERSAVVVEGRRPSRRRAYFAGAGWMETTVALFDAMKPGEQVDGPAIVESETTTVVIPPGGSASRSPSGSLVARFSATASSQAAIPQERAMR